MTESIKKDIKKSTPEQIKKKREAAKAAVAMLADAYPGVFDLDQPKPLKIGIHHDLTEDSKISKTQMRKALSAYTRHYNYVACLASGGIRIDLTGAEGEAVTEEEMMHAKGRIEEIDQAKAAKKKHFEDRKKFNEDRKKHQARKKEQVKQSENRLEKKLEALIAKSTSGS